MSLQALDAALKTVLPGSVFHFQAHKPTGNYIVWAEDGQADAVHGNNRMQEQALTGTTDYFTRTKFDPDVQRIQKAMSDSKISWKLESIQKEDDTGYIHYEWVWQIAVNPHG